MKQFEIHTLPRAVAKPESRFARSLALGLSILGLHVASPSTAQAFTMDGTVDSPHYLVADTGMRIWAAVQGNKLYFATWSSQGGTSDHFLLCSKDFGNPEQHPWNKAGTCHYYFAGWPWLAAEGDTSASPFFTLNNGGASGRSAMGTGGKVLEGEIDLTQVFGSVPTIIYLSALAYGDANGSGILGQSPAAWDADNNLQIAEYAALNIASLRDEDGDGYHDAGKPTFQTAGEDANYGLRRFFIDEATSQSASLELQFTPNVNPAETVSQVEVITNLNRRDFASIEENRNLATSTSATYYRAYPMTQAAGQWSATLPVSKCGAYRATVRYYVDGLGPYYYTDHGQRRDLAIVVSPQKALDVSLYEVNPLTVEATAATQAGRSTFRDLWTQNTDRTDVVNLDHFTNLGINMLWLQPIHPIGNESRGLDPANNQPYDPGSPYAVKDYWKVNPLMGAQNTAAGALAEFQAAVAQFDARGIGIMMDGTFNHCAPDAVFGQGAAHLFPWGPNAVSSEIRNLRPQWFSKTDSYGLPATNAAEIALAPDRSNFGKWTDVRELYFGNYDTLVKNASPSHAEEFLLERDVLLALPQDARDVWEYFAYYPLYWLDQTGHPVGTPQSQAEKGIDGLRCDFAQGLPSQFWEYCINKTRQRKWNFLFMAESLDGYREAAGSKRHGVSYRSARQFDVLNENFVFHWRDTHFAYPTGTKNRSTGATTTAYSHRREAFEGVPLLLNLTSHDEILPSNNAYELLYAHAQCATLDGMPMLLYGQEAGMQNDFAAYASTGIPNANKNFARYELNFGKSIPHFKKWNAMTGVWSNRDWTVQDLYGRVNRARLASPALRSRVHYFLNRTGGQGADTNIYAVAKFLQATKAVSQQEVVLCFVNTDHIANGNRTATFDLSATTGGKNWFGIEPTHSYQARDLLAPNPTAYAWPSARTGADLIANGLSITLNASASTLGQAKYLRLVDTTTPQDSDADGMSDAFELTHSLDPFNPTDAASDADSDGQTNLQEYLAETDPRNPASLLRLLQVARDGNQTTLTWSSVPAKSYRVQTSETLSAWTTAATVPSGGASTSWSFTPNDPRRFYRIEVVP